MAKGNSVVLSVASQGYRREGTSGGALSPGQVVKVKAATEPTGGRHTYEAGGSTGTFVQVVDIDYLQGKTASDAYASGDRLPLYIPLPGDELNVLVASGVGALAIGDKLEVNASGKCVALTTGTAVYEVLETITVGGSDTLVYAQKL